jgi:hypothetical protein
MHFNVIPKQTVKQRETLMHEKVISHQYRIEIKEIQTLLSKNKTLALTKPLESVAAYFALSPDKLRGAIQVVETEEGFVPIIRMDDLDPMKSFHKFKQVSDTLSCRRPIFDLKMDAGEWCYKSRSGAVISLLLHMLMNLRKKDNVNWMLQYLQHTKEILILVPVADNLGTMQVVATIFRTKKIRGAPVYCRFFNSLNVALPWFEVGRDNFGLFDGSFLKMTEY